LKKYIILSNTKTVPVKIFFHVLSIKAIRTAHKISGIDPSTKKSGTRLWKKEEPLLFYQLFQLAGMIWLLN